MTFGSSPESAPYTTLEAFPGALLLRGFSLDKSVRDDWARTGFVAQAALYRDGFHYLDEFGNRFSTVDNRELTPGSKASGIQFIGNASHRAALDAVSVAEARGDTEPGSTVDAFNNMFKGTFTQSKWVQYLPEHIED